MLIELLRIGEYTIGRLGKTNYAKYTYTVDENGIIFNVDPDSYDITHAASALLKEIKTFFDVTTQISHDDVLEQRPNWIHLHRDYFDTFINRLTPDSELAVALVPAQLLLDLSKKEPIETLTQIINHKHPAFITSYDNQGNCSYKVRTIFSEYLASDIAVRFQENLNYYLKQQAKYKDRENRGIIMPIKMQNREFHPPTENIVSKETQQDLMQLFQEKQDDIEKDNHSDHDAAILLANSTKNRKNGTAKASYVQIYNELVIISFPERPDGRKKQLTNYAQRIQSAPNNEKADYKNICLLFIQQLFHSMINLSEIADLFDHLLTLQSQIDVHKNPWADTIFRIKNTESWQKTLGNIRNYAFSVLDREYNHLTSERKFEQAKTMLNEFRDRNIFAAHRANGIMRLGNTEAVNDIDLKIASISPTR